MSTDDNHFERDHGEGYPNLDEYEPRDSDFESRTRENFRSQGFMHMIGAEMSRLKPSRCELTVSFDDALSQQHGFFHGGIVATLADVSGGYAAFSLLQPDRTNVTAEFKLNLMAPADGDSLVADAVVLNPGRTLTICRSDVFFDLRKFFENALCNSARNVYGRYSRVAAGQSLSG